MKKLPYFSIEELTKNFYKDCERARNEINACIELFYGEYEESDERKRYIEIVKGHYVLDEIMKNFIELQCRVWISQPEVPKELKDYNNNLPGNSDRKVNLSWDYPMGIVKHFQHIPDPRNKTKDKEYQTNIT